MRTLFGARGSRRQRSRLPVAVAAGAFVLSLIYPASPGFAQQTRAALLASLQQARSEHRARDDKLREARGSVDAAWSEWQALRRRLLDCPANNRRRAALTQVDAAHRGMRGVERELHRQRAAHRRERAIVAPAANRSPDGQPSDKLRSWVDSLTRNGPVVEALIRQERLAATSYRRVYNLTGELQRQCIDNSSPLALIASTGGKYIREIHNVIKNWWA